MLRDSCGVKPSKWLTKCNFCRKYFFFENYADHHSIVINLICSKYLRGFIEKFFMFHIVGLTTISNFKNDYETICCYLF